jgi:hypothetical protein
VMVGQMFEDRAGDRQLPVSRRPHLLVPVGWPQTGKDECVRWRVGVRLADSRPVSGLRMGLGMTWGPSAQYLGVEAIRQDGVLHSAELICLQHNIFHDQRVDMRPGLRAR